MENNISKRKKAIDVVRNYFSFAKRPQNKPGPNPTSTTFHPKTTGTASRNLIMGLFHTLNGRSAHNLSKTQWTPGDGMKMEKQGRATQYKPKTSRKDGFFPNRKK